MAGSYVDYPAPRIPWNLDGSVGFTINSSGTIATLSGANMNGLNGEAGFSVTNLFGTSFPTYFGVIFPELRDISHFYLRAQSVITDRVLQVSDDTTNGQDGTWTDLSTTFAMETGPIAPSWRSAIQTLTGGSGIKAIRFKKSTGSAGVNGFALHLFGEYTSGENPDRLEIWDPTSNVPFDPAIDFGDRPQASALDLTFRVKNVSATDTANSIVVSAVDSSDSSPSYTDSHTFSSGGAFSSTINIGNLAPGAISGVLTVRQTLGATQPLGLWAAILKAVAGSWS